MGLLNQMGFCVWLHVGTWISWLYDAQKLKWKDPRLGARRPGFAVLSPASFLGHLVQISLSHRHCPNVEPVTLFVNCSVWATLALKFPSVQAGGDCQHHCRSVM